MKKIVDIHINIHLHICYNDAIMIITRFLMNLSADKGKSIIGLINIIVMKNNASLY